MYADGIRSNLLRMGHSHAHHDPHQDEELARIREFMHADHRRAIAKVAVAVEHMASPIWQILNAFGIYKR